MKREQFTEETMRIILNHMRSFHYSELKLLLELDNDSIV